MSNESLTSVNIIAFIYVIFQETYLLVYTEIKNVTKSFLTYGFLRECLNVFISNSKVNVAEDKNINFES